MVPINIENGMVVAVLQGKQKGVSQKKNNQNVLKRKKIPDKIRRFFEVRRCF